MEDFFDDLDVVGYYFDVVWDYVIVFDIVEVEVMCRCRIGFFCEE